MDQPEGPVSRFLLVHARMASWDVTLTDAGPADAPVFLRIARGIIEDIHRGRLKPGQRLPGTRAWAKALEVNRNTVVAAVAELEAQGWVRSTPTRGTWVVEQLPVEPRLQRKPGLPSLGLQLEPLPPFLIERHFTLPTGVMHLSVGTPDPRLFPVELIARTWRRVGAAGSARTATGPSAHRRTPAASAGASTS